MGIIFDAEENVKALGLGENTKTVGLDQMNEGRAKQKSIDSRQFQCKTRGPLRDAQVYSGLKTKSTLDIEDDE
jgi:hypothetical protein